MKERIYIETTFVSYLTARPSRDLIVAGHQQITHDWWDSRRGDYELCVSELVLQEAGDGDPQAAQERLDVLAKMTVWKSRKKLWNWRKSWSEPVRCRRKREMMRCTSP
jgi:hypothetical protein